MTVRVLVADDQELIRVGLAAILQARPELDVVETAADGAEAVRLVRELRPDIALMDIRMPGTDGLEATRLLTSDPGQVTRVVMLTTFDDDDLVLDALRAGASGFLLKDLPRHRLVESILAVHAGELQLSSAITRRLVAQRLSRGVGADRISHLDQLSEREREILALAARGATNGEIASTLFISESTVKTHIGQLYTKLGVRDRVQLVIFAYDTGIVP